jgi:hypothetical protein
MGNNTHAIEAGTFLATLRSGSRWRDAAAIIVVPMLTVALFLAPNPVRQSLVFEYAHPTLLSAYAAPFVHLHPVHLLVNLVGFLLVVSVVYVLDVLAGRRRRFGVVFTTIIVAFPVLLSYLNLAIFRPAGTVGLSGIVMAFVGYLPIALADYAHVQFDLPEREYVAPVLFFLGFAVIAVLSVISVAPDNLDVLLGITQLVLATVLAALLFGLPLIESRAQLATELRRASGKPGYFEFMGIATVLFLSFPLVAFPPDPVAGAVTVNLYAHLIGLSLGFTAVYTTMYLSDLLPIDTTFL